MARDAVGLGTWESLPEAKREELINIEIWKTEVQERLAQEGRDAINGDGGEIVDSDNDADGMPSKGAKTKKQQQGKKKKTK